MSNTVSSTTAFQATPCNQELKGGSDAAENIKSNPNRSQVCTFDRKTHIPLLLKRKLWTGTSYPLHRWPRLLPSLSHRHCQYHWFCAMHVVAPVHPSPPLSRYLATIPIARHPTPPAHQACDSARSSRKDCQPSRACLSCWSWCPTCFPRPVSQPCTGTGTRLLSAISGQAREVNLTMGLSSMMVFGSGP